MKIRKIKIINSIILSLFCSTILFSQTNDEYKKYNLGGGIGVHLFNSPDFTDYLNSISTKRFDDFLANPEFFLSFGVHLIENYSLNLDYTYIINDFSLDYLSFIFDNNLKIHIPILILYRNYKTNGVIFKLGAGAGYAYSILSRKILGSSPEKFYSKGGGVKLAIEANTPFGDNIYGLISSDIKLIFMNKMKKSDLEELIFRYGNKERSLKLNFFNISLKFGFIYYF